MAGYRPGTTWGSIYDAAKAPWTPLGSTGQFADMTAIIEPDNPFDTTLKNLQAVGMQQDQNIKQKKFDLLQGMMHDFGKGRNMFGQGSGSFSSTPMNSIPAPQYVSAGPIWTQGQIDSKANLARGNLLANAATASNSFTRDLAARGFSPVASPFGMFAAQNNLMKANAAAAANETNLNWQAAEGNANNIMQGNQVNAGMYGNYANALADQNRTLASLQSSQNSLLGNQQSGLMNLYQTIFQGLL